MFERFTTDAREAVIGAQVQARALCHGRIGTEHLLLGLLAQPSTAATAALDACGLTAEDARRAVIDATEDPRGEAAALEAIGIDLDRVRAAVEASFGEGALERAGRWRRRGRRGHIPLTDAAKQSLELSLREALRRGDRSIGSEHILLGILQEGRGLGARVLAARGIDRHAVEAVIDGRGRRAS